ncbi:MAG: HEAT repeat domain-containing protein [Planctomycetota bacterium]|nr:HEAT repeat domain-containing protein [Planctomycetota bacterium]
MLLRPLLLRVLLLALVIVSGVARSAHADDEADARRDFRAEMKDGNWKVRRGAFVMLLDYDGAKPAQECLAAILKEKNPAVQLEGIKTLGQFETPAAHAALLAELARAKGEKAAVLLMALAEQKGHSGVDELSALLGHKDAMKAALAALALGRKKASQATGALVLALGHEDPRVQSAAARAFKTWAWSDKTKPAANSGKLPEPAMPPWFKLETIQWALIDALENAVGAPRGDMIEALEFITRKDYGDNWAAWVAHARGEEITKKMLKQRIEAPHFVGVPVWGKRIVIVMDANVLTDREHPFKDRTRLQELCENPGRPSLPWHKIKSVKHFNDAWVRRFVMDLPHKGMQFELIRSGLKPKSVFGRLKPVNGGTKKAALTAVEEGGVENGNDVLAAMTQALDISGKKDSVAWTKGPDVICCVYSSVPWLADETDAEVVGAAIGLKARRRLVKSHAMGVHEFAYAMMKLFAEQTGGAYRELIK